MFCLLNIQSDLLRSSEQEKAIREKERVCKAKWRASKGPRMIHNTLRKSRGMIERGKEIVHHVKTVHHYEDSTSSNGSTSQKISEPDLPCTPVK